MYGSITCLRGYPGSGKSRLAARYREAGHEVVNRDSLRMMLLGSWWTGKPEDEDRVTVAERALVEGYLRAGKHVVIDACHVNPRYLREWAKVAVAFDVPFEVVDVATPVDECVINDETRAIGGGRGVGEAVIRKMAKRWPMKNWPNVVPRYRPKPGPVVAVRSLPKAVICDIDGTLTMGPHDRSPYDYSKVSQDQPRKALNAILAAIRFTHDTLLEDDFTGIAEPLTVFIMSGRDDTCREDTEQWLEDNHVSYDHLLMRDTAGDVDERGGKLPDVNVKLRLFDEHVRDQFDVVAVFDDRLQVCRLWHQLGLPLFRVGDPESDF